MRSILCIIYLVSMTMVLDVYLPIYLYLWTSQRFDEERWKQRQNMLHKQNRKPRLPAKNSKEAERDDKNLYCKVCGAEKLLADVLAGAEKCLRCSTRFVPPVIWKEKKWKQRQAEKQAIEEARIRAVRRVVAAELATEARRRAFMEEKDASGEAVAVAVAAPATAAIGRVSENNKRVPALAIFARSAVGRSLARLSEHMISNSTSNLLTSQDTNKSVTGVTQDAIRRSHTQSDLLSYSDVENVGTVAAEHSVTSASEIRQIKECFSRIDEEVCGRFEAEGHMKEPVVPLKEHLAQVSVIIVLT